MFLRHWARLSMNLTQAEEALEPEIAALGERYRVQWPFFNLHCIADFVLLDRALVIEVDGDSHNALEAKIKDQVRTIALKKAGWNVVRVRNEAVLLNPKLALVQVLRCPPSTVADLERELQALYVLQATHVRSGAGTGTVTKRPDKLPRPRTKRGRAPSKTSASSARGHR